VEQLLFAEVRRINTKSTARVFAEPGAEWPNGRAYALRLDRVRDAHGNVQEILEGDRLRIVIDTSDPERVVRAERLAAVGGGTAVSPRGQQVAHSQFAATAGQTQA
jgi:hypothetical protein